MNRRELFRVAVGAPLGVLAGSQVVASEEPKEVLFRVGLDVDVDKTVNQISQAINAETKKWERQMREEIERQIRDMKPV